MTGVLVTGGTGKTGRALVEILRGAGVPVRVASRTPSPGDPDAVRFDWDDATTHRAALREMDRVYLVAPPVAVDPMPLVEPFLAEARRLGVQRVVLLGSAIEFPNAPGMLELAARVRVTNRAGWCCARRGSCRTSCAHTPWRSASASTARSAPPPVTVGWDGSTRETSQRPPQPY
jgi:NAD(P)-dependent dehydrogenase (short-subunit alcohol dehydrogenase family)